MGVRSDDTKGERVFVKAQLFHGAENCLCEAPAGAYRAQLSLTGAWLTPLTTGGPAIALSLDRYFQHRSEGRIVVAGEEPKI